MRNSHARILFLAFVAAAIIVLLASCHIKKDLTKSKTEVDQAETTHAAVSATTAITSTVTEKAKGEVVVPEKSMSVTGKGPIIFDGPVFSGTVVTDAAGLTHVEVKSKSFTVDYEIDKIIVSAIAGTFNGIIDKAKETHSVVATFEKHKDVDAGFNWNWLWLIVPIVVLVIVWKNWRDGKSV